MKKRTFRLLSVLAALSLAPITSVVTGCKPTVVEVEKFKLTWNVDPNATVKVEGVDELPSELGKDSSLIFTVTVKDGFSLDKVKVNSKRVNPDKEGKYSVTVTGNTDISITAIEEVSELLVEKAPDKLLYFAGEQLDLTGMVVKAKYKTGREAVLEKGRDGYETDITDFVGGETSFKVLFGSLEAEVKLDEVVKYKATIDSKGGVIFDSYIDNLTSMSLAHFTVSDDKDVISFAFLNDLPTKIELPKAEEISKENNKFIGWDDNKAITNDVKQSVVKSAKWQPELIKVTKLELKVEDDTPYMILTGEYLSSTSVALFLYEGNAKVQLVGDIYTGEAGQPFNAKFDLTRLVDARTDDGSTFEGKWMDIRFLAGDVSNPKECDNMELFDDGSIEIDTSSKIKVKSITYLFATYNNAIKVYYKAAQTDYTVSFATIEGIDYLVIDGLVVDKAFANKVLAISWWEGYESEKRFADIDADGNFTLNIPLADFVLNTNYFAHLHILDSRDSETNLLGDGDHNLLVADCNTEFEPVDLGGDVHHAIRYENADHVAYYCGYAWDGLMMYVRDEDTAFSFNVGNVDVESDDNGAYYVINGTFTGNIAKAVVQIDFQHYSPWEDDYPGDSFNWQTINHVDVPATDLGEGKFAVRVKVDDSLAINGRSCCYLVHAGVGGKSDFKAYVTSSEVTYNGFKYSLNNNVNKNSWDNGVACLIVVPVE